MGDVCIPLHKAQLLENIPYFKAMFAHNWRENNGKSYAITNERPKKMTQKEIDEFYDQPSSSKNPPVLPPEIEEDVMDESGDGPSENDKISKVISNAVAGFSAEAQVLYFKSIYSSDIDANQPAEDLLETFQLAD